MYKAIPAEQTAGGRMIFQGEVPPCIFDADYDAMLKSFFPLRKSEHACWPRLMLAGVDRRHVSSLCMQHAFNRGRRGLTTLYISCGPDQPLATHPPVRPRCLGCSEAEGGEDLSVGEEEVLQSIHIKYCATWVELRDVLTSFHLADSAPTFAADEPPPHGIIIDNLPALFGSLTGEERLPQPAHTPSPSKPEQQKLAAFLAMALGLASHAADYLDDADAAAAAASNTYLGLGAVRPDHDRPVREPAMLLVACAGPQATWPEPALVQRWLPIVLRSAPCERAHRPGAHTLVAQTRIFGDSHQPTKYYLLRKQLELDDTMATRHLEFAALRDSSKAARTPKRMRPADEADGPMCQEAEEEQDAAHGSGSGDGGETSSAAAASMAY